MISNIVFIKPITPDYIKLNEKLLTKEQTDEHYNGHYLKYINNLNKIISEDNSLKLLHQTLLQKNNSIDDNNFRHEFMISIIVKYDSEKESAIYHNISQIYNHELYWSSITSSNESVTFLSKSRSKLFDNNNSLSKFYSKFIDEGLKSFGSGWAWIYLNTASPQNTFIDILITHDSITPFNNEYQKILGVIDLWEHAWYIDYKSDKKKYLESIFKLINWNNILFYYEKYNEIKK